MIHLSNDTGDQFAQAFTFAQKQVRKLIEKHPLMYQLYTENGMWSKD